LAIAWILVLGVTAAATGFVALKLTGEAERPDAGLTIALPPAEAPEATAETAPSAAVGENAAAEAQSLPTDEEPAPATAPGPPRIAVVITGLGLSKAASEQAVEHLPPQVSLSFSPYAEQLGDWIARARAKGHEVLIDLPMEPATFPDDDPGPRALMTGLEPDQNLERLRWILDRAQGFVGVTAVMGSRFTTSETALQPVFETLKARGMLFLDNRSSEAGVAGRLAARLALPHAVNDRWLDGPNPNREAIDARLVQIERLALARGFSIAMGEPYPLTLDRVANWAVSLEARGFRLAPVSALAAPQGAP
jgi:polysaccharide deacetylase 2 family uncharacterized protein YibQ